MISWVKFSQKGCFWSQTEKVNITIEFCVFELVYVPNFSSNWQICFFGPNLPKKGISGQKRKKWNHHTEFCKFELFYVPNFSLSDSFVFCFCFFLTKFGPKGYFRPKKEKSYLCVGPWSLLTISQFSARGPTDTTVF